MRPSPMPASRSSRACCKTPRSRSHDPDAVPRVAPSVPEPAAQYSL